MFKKPESVEVSVIDERITVTYPKINVPAYTAIVTYRGPDPVPRTIFIALGDVAPGKEEDAFKQFNVKSGDLYKRYLEVRAKKIREDMEKVAAHKSEVLRV